MTLFLDASALVALIAEEPEAAALMASLDRDPDLQTSAIAVWEAAVGLARVFALPPCEPLDWLQRFMEQTQVRVAPLDAQAGRLAIVASSASVRGFTPPASTWAIASPTPPRARSVHRWSTRAMISARPISSALHDGSRLEMRRSAPSGGEAAAIGYGADLFARATASSGVGGLAGCHDRHKGVRSLTGFPPSPVLK